MTPYPFMLLTSVITTC